MLGLELESVSYATSLGQVNGDFVSYFLRDGCDIEVSYSPNIEFTVHYSKVEELAAHVRGSLKGVTLEAEEYHSILARLILKVIQEEAADRYLARVNKLVGNIRD